MDFDPIKFKLVQDEDDECSLPKLFILMAGRKSYIMQKMW